MERLANGLSRGLLAGSMTSSRRCQNKQEKSQREGWL
jgi:hypothetical protein